MRRLHRLRQPVARLLRLLVPMDRLPSLQVSRRTRLGKLPTCEPSMPIANLTRLQSHYQWVIFLVVVTVGIIGIWVGAYYLRKHYLRKKEREFEMRPPVAWGPHQMQNQTGGYNYGDGVIDANAGGRTKEAKMMAASATPAGPPGAKSGWLRKGRS